METIMNKHKLEKYSAYKDSGVEWLGDIPEHWELTRLGTKFKNRKTKVSDKDYPALSVTKNGIVPQLSSAAKTNDGDNRKLVKQGDFVINSRSDRKGSSGIAYQDGSVSLINIIMEPQGIAPIYCNYLLKSFNFIEEFYRMGHGIVADLWTTRYDEMRSIKIGIPPLEEQTRIANFLDNKCAKIDQAIQQKEKLIELLKERKQIIIQNAVTRGLNPDVKMKDSGVDWIGDIPEGWKCMKFKYIIRTKARQGWKGLKADEYVDKSDYGFLATPNIKHKDIAYNDANFITQFRYYESPEIMLKRGDVLLVKDGSTLGISNIVRGLPFKCTVNSSIAVLRVIQEDKLLPEYLDLFIKSQTCQKLIEKKKDGMGVPHLFQSDINNFYIPIFDIEEQQSIVEYIQYHEIKIDKSILYQSKLIDKLKEYKQVLINEVVTGKVKV
ncbi:restriction endonuclease subunit S [Aureispira anguillae]|uniref:Restriction endonuclease subunit S n=1 Tax=Aureispira anguillae TaxID=2864201 RepID=A0A915YGL7_9BACT|nr:restriction endonuclease subunit S [Aureispira anguillae]BDS12779.1 restriction endonuclease subunit S [Aureispira anguillae]